MPDVRTLLDDLTTRVPSPDPVAAVRATVRRRDARRALAVTAAAATVGAVALTTVAVRTETAPPITQQPTATATPSLSPTPSPTPSATRSPDVGEFAAFIEVHPEAFQGYSEDPDGTLVVLFVPGVDVGQWTRELDEASGGVPFRAEHCPETMEHYDKIIMEVNAFRWPSGADVAQEAWLAPGGCLVEVTLTGDAVAAADKAAARDRWGAEVTVRSER